MRAILAALALTMTVGLASCGTTDDTVVVPAAPGQAVVVPEGSDQTTVVVPTAPVAPK